MRAKNTPTNWVYAQLNELISFAIGGDWGKDTNHEDPDYAVAYCIRGSKFRNWNKDRGITASLRKIKKTSLIKRTLTQGDILLEISGGGPDQPVGRTVLIDRAVLSFAPKIPKIWTNFLRLLRPYAQINSEYLNYYLISFYKSGEIVRYQGGSNNLRNLKFDDFISILIPIPPLAEQYRIVAKIEELFSDLDAGIASLKTAQAQLKIYRQAVLKWAFEGKLTADWRKEKQQKGELKSADELLAQIKAEREKRYKEQVKDWETAVKAWEAGGKVGKKPTKPKMLKEVEPLSEEAIAELPGLPEGWRWIIPDMIASSESYALGIGPFGSNLKVSDYTKSGYPLIFVRHITSSNFDLNAKYISSQKFDELFPHAVKPLDLLITKMGDPPGDCEIYPENRKEGILTSDCLKFRVWDEFINRKLYKYRINSILIKRQLGLITKGVAQKKIGSPDPSVIIV
jgi:type I restriction enzyme S subunit